MIAKYLMKKILHYFIFLCVVFIYPSTIFAKNNYIVWPPENESGTFYLSTEKNKYNNRFPRKGYLRAMTPITIKENNGKIVSRWLHEVSGGNEFRYLEFISSSGAYGYIKESSVKPLNQLSIKRKKDLLREGYSNIIIPLHPLKEVSIYRVNGSGKLIKKHSFSRSSHDLVVSNGNKKKVETSIGVRKQLLEASYFMLLADGSYKITSGWLDNSENTKLFDVFPVTSINSSKINEKLNQSFLGKVKNLWEHWINNYDDNKLASAMKKECDSEVNMSFDVKLSGETPVSLVKLSGGATGKITYQFPRGYRYKTALFEDLERNSNIKVLKTIKCKNNSTSDWYADRVVFVRNKDKFELFQDGISKKMDQYFETPSATGPLRKREKMIQLKTLDSSKKDYYSAFYKLNNYINASIYNKLELDSIDKIRLNTVVLEQIVEF
ncbi:MAG: hypothetical protein GQ532_03895 [Methylomarinum sp.]|nr:hypothetical protein [Methylomarinum sp.]